VTGLYNNAGEAIREALRLMVERETGAHAPKTPRKTEVPATLKALEPELLPEISPPQPRIRLRRAW
jgi:Arc/MetJ-type ribon-helix-helix transcriptional regulator